MLLWKRVGVSEGIDIDKTDASKECMFCHQYFKDNNFTIELNVCDNCHDVLMTAYELEDIEVLNEESLDYKCILWGITKYKAVTRSNKIRVI